MTSRNSFWDRCRQNFKRRQACLFINSIVLAVLGPFVMFLSLSAEKSRLVSESRGTLTASEMQKALEYLQEIAKGILGPNDALAVFIMILAIICGIQGFGYLHHREKVDMYKSQPVSNQKRFFSIYLNGITIFVIPYLLMTVLSVLVAVFYQVMTAEIFGMTVICFIMQTLFYVLVYSVAICAVMLTGNLVTSILGSVTLLFYCSLWRILITMYRGLFYDTAVSVYGNYNSFDMVLGENIPFGFTAISYFNHVSKMLPVENASELLTGSIKVLVTMAVLMIVAIAVGYILYVKRKVEVAGDSIAFGGFKKGLILAIEIPVALFGAFVIGSWIGNGDGVTFYIVGLITAVLLCHIVMQWIVEKNLTAAKKGIAWTAASGVIAGLCFCNYYFDWMGYDCYVPDEKELVSASINFGYPGRDYFDWESGEYMEYREYFDKYMDYTDKEAIIQLSEANYFNQDGKGKSNHCNLIEKEQRQNGKVFFYIYVNYKLKNGRQVYRNIPVEVEKYTDILNHIVSSEEFKESYYQFANDRWLEIAEESIAGEVENGMDNVKLTKEQIAEIRELYLKDLEDFNFEKASRENVVLKMYVGTNKQNEPRRITCDIYESFDNTIRYLEENGVTSVMQIETDQIERISVADWDNYGIYVEEIYTEPEDVEAIVSKLRLDIWSNYWGYDYNPYNIYAECKGGVGSQHYYLKYGEELPEFVLEDLEEAAKTADTEKTQ